MYSNVVFEKHLFFKNEARKINHQEVVEEDRRAKLPNNWEAKMARVEWEEKEDKLKKVCRNQMLISFKIIPQFNGSLLKLSTFLLIIPSSYIWNQLRLPN